MVNERSAAGSRVQLRGLQCLSPSQGSIAGEVRVQVDADAGESKK